MLSGIKKAARRTPRLLCAFLACLLSVGAFCACSGGSQEESAEPLTELDPNQAMSFFNEARNTCLTGAYRSVADLRAEITVKTEAVDENGEPNYSVRVVSERIEGLYRRDLDPQTESIAAYSSPSSSSAEDLPTELMIRHFSAVRVGDDCFCDYTAVNGGKRRTDYQNDVSSCLGLLSLAGGVPRSSRSVKGGGEVRADFTFSSDFCSKTQDVLAAFLINGLDFSSFTFSSLSVSSFIDEESGAFKSLTLSFTLKPKDGGNTTIRITHSETFSSFGTTEEIPAPDPSLYSEL